jgi:hypothetical protein
LRTLQALLLALFVTTPAWAQDGARAVRPDSADLIAVGRVRAGFGVEFLQRARYSLSGLEGDLVRLGVIDVRVGVGEYAEFQISGVARDYLTITGRSPAVLPPTITGDTTDDFGDLMIGAKMKLVPEKRARPAMAFKFEMQLPNATNESGLGNDETEFYSSLLFTKHLGRARITGNLGLAILGSPVQANSQADLMTYGVCADIPLHPRLELVGEWYGRQGPHRVGNESLSQVRLGARIRAAGVLWDVAGIAGLKHFDPRSGIAVGVTFDFQAFHRSRGPVTIPPEKPQVKK